MAHPSRSLLLIMLSLAQPLRAQLPEWTWQNPEPTGPVAHGRGRAGQPERVRLRRRWAIVALAGWRPFVYFVDLGTADGFSAISSLGRTPSYIAAPVLSAAPWTAGTSWTVLPGGISVYEPAMFFLDDQPPAGSASISAAPCAAPPHRRTDLVVPPGGDHHLAQRSAFRGRALHGWVVEATAALMRTVDGGATWLPSPSGVTVQIAALWFNDTLNGWAGTSNGTLLHTIDGGNAGHPPSSPPRKA